MNTKNLPTKNNLIKIKQMIKQSKEGQKFLEQKKMILMRELEKYKLQKQQLMENGKNLLGESYHWLQMANVEIGIDDMLSISEGIKVDDTLDIKYKTVMGTQIPSIVPEEQKIMINYSLYHTTNSVDRAILKWGEVKKYILELASVESTIFRLKKEIEKVQQRSNTLKEVIIPKDEKTAKEIQDILDENEKEEFIRLKTLKKKI